MTENKGGLVEDEKKTKTHGPRAFLATEGFNISDGFLRGGERRNLVFNSGTEGPRFDSGQKTFKKRELYTPARTYPHNKSPHLLIFSLDLEGRAKVTFDALC